MPNFSQQQQDQLKVVLGYASTPNLLTTELQESRTQAVIDRTLSLLDELEEIDTKLKAATSDSMAQSVGTLKLSYSQHINHLKSEGSRLLKELTSLLGTGCNYNKYRPGNATSKVSYW